jgi:hypothetical protein
MSAHAWSVALLVATAGHAGFQLTVTLLVYPALVGVRPADWTTSHGAHSRRITPLVAVLYAAALTAGVGAVLSSPRSPGVWVAALGTAGALLVTAAAAGPTHGRLAAGRTDALVSRLLAADRIRLLLALVAVVGAVLAAR